MIADRDTDVPEGYREGIGAQGALELAGANGPELGFCRCRGYQFLIVRLLRP